MLNVNYHWEKLQTCIVGICYPPEFFSFIKDSNVRKVMETISQETNEDLDNLVKLLKSFDVNILRPELDNIEKYIIGDKILPPPLTPRDHIATIGNKVFMPSIDNKRKWNQLRGESWPICPPESQIEFENLPHEVKEELNKCWQIDRVEELYNFDFTVYKNVEKYVKFTNEIIYDQDIDSAMVIRLGKDLYFGTWPWQTEKQVLDRVSTLFPDYNCHVIESNGHLDGCLCVVSPNLILTTKHMSKQRLDKLFHNYEIIEISNKNTGFSSKFKKQSQGKWWIKGEEDNIELVNFVNSYLKFWTGYMEETVSIINILHIDKNNVICIGNDDKLFKKLKEYEITAHPIKFRHLHFWDSGVHCLTNDIGRIKV